MIKNRTAQLIYQSFFCAFALIGVPASMGLFDHAFWWDFYIHFTNLSNYLCIGVMFAELIQTARKQEDSFVNVLPKLKFISMLGILLTFLVFNLLLAGQPTRDPAMNFKVNSVCLHIILPIMYIADWFLFYERGRVKPTWPLLSVLFPLSYLAFVFIHAALRHFDTSILTPGGGAVLIYPYFFLRVDQIGVGGVFKWCVILFIAFILAGYLFFGADRFLAGKNRTRENPYVS